MNIFKKRKFTAAIVIALVLALVIPTYADVTQDEIDEAIAVREEQEQELASTEERISELEQHRGDSEAYLNELSGQLEDLSGRLTDISERYAGVCSELDAVKAELEEQNAIADEQYEDMKLRIQYMYEESTNAGLLEALFSAESFTEFLNRAETMSEINQYDREMLDSYSRTIGSIQAKEQEILKEQEELEALKEELTAEQAQIQEIYQATYSELNHCIEELTATEQAESELVARIRRQQESIDYLLAEAYAQEAARRAEEEAAAAAAAQAAEAAAQAEAEETPAAEPAAEESAPAEGGTYLGNFTLTAYCGCAKCCGQWASSNPTTASGAPCVQGVTVAMGGVPFGTKLLINGNVYTVQDRGTAYGHVDIYFANHSDALAFGLKHADVYQVG